MNNARACLSIIKDRKNVLEDYLAEMVYGSVDSITQGLVKTRMSKYVERGAISREKYPDGITYCLVDREKLR